MADTTQTIPVELLLSHIGKQVKVDIEAHREKLEDQIAKRRQRLEELRARRMEVSANAVVAAPVEDTAATPPPLPVSVLDTAAELDDTGDDDWLMEMPLDDDEMGGDVMPSSLDTGDGGDIDLPELDNDLLTDLPDLDDDADGGDGDLPELDDDLLTVAHNDTPATLDDSLSSGTGDDVITEESTTDGTGGAATGMDDILSDVKALDPDLVDDGWEF